MQARLTGDRLVAAACYCRSGRQVYSCITCMAWHALWRRLVARAGGGAK